MNEFRQQIKEIQRLIASLDQSSPAVRLEIMVMEESLNRILESLIEFSVKDFNNLIYKKR